jgi:hypothetical protein
LEEAGGPGRKKAKRRRGRIKQASGAEERTARPQQAAGRALRENASPPKKTWRAHEIKS